MISSTKRFKTKFAGVVYRECETNGKPDKVYYIRFKDQAGKSIEQKVGKFSEGIRQEYCNTKRNELITKCRLGEPVKLKYAKKDITQFEDLANAYFHNRKDTESTSKDKNLQKNHLDPYFQVLDMDQLEEHNFQEFKKEKLKTLSVKSVNNALTLLTAILNFAYRKKMIKSDYSIYIKKEKVDNARERFLSADEIQKLYQEIEKNHDDMLLLVVKIALTTGARIGSILTIERKNIDFKHNILTMKDHKNDSTFSAFLTEDVKKMLHSYLEKNEIDVGKFFPVVNTTIQKPLREIFDRLFNAKLDKKDRKNRVVFHTLRHTFASHLAINGTPIFTIQKLMNHKDIKMSMRYAKLSPESGRESVNGLNF
jgi:integrase